MAILKCYGCGRGFEWEKSLASPNAPSYHSRACKDRSNRNRQATMPRKCPRPDKQVFASQRDAQLLADKVGKDNNIEPLGVYRCVCGGIHIGNRTVLEKV